MLKKVIPILFLASCFTLPVMAQNIKDIDQILQYLGEEIQRVTVIVEKSGNKQAEKILQNGIDHYEKGAELHNQGNDNAARKQLVFAARLIKRAEMTAKGQMGLEERIRRLGEKIRQVKALVDQSGNKKAESVLKNGIDHYDKSVSFYNDGKIQAASAELAASHKFVNKAEAMVKAQGNLDDQIKRVGLKIKAVEILVEQSGSKKAADVLEKGKDHYGKAIDLNNEGKIREARVQLEHAKKLILRAEKIAQG